MSEFLKNNPIALRHCLLYEFLQEKSVEKAFDNFCKTVGADVIEKEEFQHWFDQFEQRKFDDNKEQMDNIVDILRNDKHALRVCVLYEYLDKKQETFTLFMKGMPLRRKLSKVFEKYIDFCKVIGDDVMEYREFESWFFRFSKKSKRDFNLNYEGDKDKKMYELTDMPVDIMRNIVEYLGILNRGALAGTCQSFKTFVENQKLFHHTLGFKLNEGSAQIEFGSGTKSISYGNRPNGCNRITGWKRKKLIPNVLYWKQALQDFKSILNLPKLHLDTLRIDFTMDKTQNQDPWEFHSATVEEAISALGDALSLTHHVSVKNLHLDAYTVKPLLRILPALKPGYLTMVEFCVNDPEYDLKEEIASLEQWKHAKSVTMLYGLFVGSLHCFRHFPAFQVNLWELSVEHIRQIKEILFISPDFEKCSLGIRNPVDMAILRQEFGDALPGFLWVFHYSIPNSNEYFEIYYVYGTINIVRMKK